MSLKQNQTIDALIVGAGFAGLVMAERLSNELGWNCVVVDKRDHIGGNAYDYYDEAGVLVHKYGPHYFRSNSSKVIDYLSQFTDWHPVSYRVQSYTEDKYWSFPINLTTFEQLIGRPSTTEEFEAWLEEKKEDIPFPSNSEEVITSQVGRELYEKFFKGYTQKQWKRDPSELDSSVCGRVPIRTNRDERYLREEFQAMPKEGYTALFEKLIKATPNVEIELEQDWEAAREKWTYKHLIFTGPIDAYFNYSLGKLPYRSLKFEHESFQGNELEKRKSVSGSPTHWQPEMQVNYPGLEVDFTRIVEIKHATGQEIEATTIVREYPADYEETAEPYYPVPMASSKALYKQYEALAKKEENVTFLGRLGTYRYYNMDQVVAMALKQFDNLSSRFMKQH